MNFNIKKKLILGFGLVLLIFSLVILFSINVISDSNKHIIHIKDVANKQVEYANSINISVIQVQQWLSDASATKSQDSFKKAEEYKVLFKDTLKKISELNLENQDKYKKIDQDFDKFYDIGVKMANTYIDEGTEKGNELMAKFDPLADTLTKAIDELQKQSKNSMEDDLMTVHDHMSMNLQISVIMGVAALILAIVVIIILGGQISIPIRNMLLILTDIERGHGDLTRRINIKSKDEIGKMAEAFNKFIDSMEQMITKIRKNSGIVSKGSELLNSNGIQSTEGIKQINQNMFKVTEDNLKIKDSISFITASISEIAQASQETASDAQEICNVAVEINKIAQSSGKLALDTKLEMEEIERVSSETIGITERLGNEAGEIGKIIDTIKAITNQTNLLALNAAIEAARAGEQGRGFGVVAEEIRKLAESNNQSAKTIESLIKNIQGMIIQTIKATKDAGTNIKSGSKLVEDVYAQLQYITKGVSNINDRIQSIAASTEEQSASTEELSATMEYINNNSTGIAASVQEVAASISIQAETISGLSSTASDLNESADQLNSLVNKFKLKDM